MPRQRFSIATFNVKNLVNAETNYYQKKDGSWNRYSQAKFDQKVTWLAQQLTLMDADFVCLQEIFHEEALLAVVDRYNALVAHNELKQDPYVDVLHVPNDRSKEDDPSPGLAFLGRRTRLSDRKVQDLSEQPIELSEEFGLSYTLSATSRPISIVEIDLGAGRSGILINTHLKSKRPMLGKDSPADEPGNFLFLERAKGAMGSLVLRAGEALAVRREILAISKGSSVPVFVVGDLNDEETAVTSELVRGESPWRHEPDFDIKKGFWDVEMYSAAKTHLRRSEQAEFTTHIFNGHHSTLDHIFFSQEFYYRNGARIGDLDYVRSFNDHVVDRDMPGAPSDPGASDHGQLVAYFSFEEPVADADQ